MANIIKLGGGSGGGSSTIVSKSITDNGTYYASSDNADGYNPVIVSVSGGSVTTLALYSGKINLSNGQISADSDYYYSDYFDAPNGSLMFDLGENGSTYVGLEMCTANGSHYDYYSANRYRVVDHSSRYSSAPKMRISFKVSMLNDVIVKNLVDGTAYSIGVVKLEPSNN